MKLLLASSFDKFGEKIEQISDLELGKKSVLCITTAANVETNKDWLEPELIQIKKRAKAFDVYDICDKSEESLRLDFKSYDVIYVSGGNTYFLLEKAKKSGFQQVVSEKLEQGGFYLGGSAGAVLTCPRIDFISTMDNPSKASLNNYNGLSFVDFLVLPHMDNPSYFEIAREIAIKLSSGNELCIGLRDNQAIYVKNKYIDIF